eukprot:3880042-Rhodomonas_salina.1
MSTQRVRSGAERVGSNTRGRGNGGGKSAPSTRKGTRGCMHETAQRVGLLGSAWECWVQGLGVGADRPAAWRRRKPA